MWEWEGEIWEWEGKMGELGDGERFSPLESWNGDVETKFVQHLTAKNY